MKRTAILATALLVVAGCSSSPPTEAASTTATPAPTTAPAPSLSPPQLTSLDALVEGIADVDVATVDADGLPLVVVQDGPTISRLYRGSDPAAAVPVALPFQGLGRTAVLAAGVTDDGTAVLLGQTGETGRFAVARVAPDGSLEQLPALATLPAGASRLGVVSADAGTVVLGSVDPAAPDRLDLLVVDAGTGAVRVAGGLTGLPAGAELVDLAVAPDGSLTTVLVASAAADGGPGRDLVLLRADAALQPLPPVAVGEGVDPDRAGVDVGPTGTAVVLTRGDDDGPAELRPVRPDATGSDTPVIVDGVVLAGVAVTPDGRAVVVRDQQLVAVDLATGETTSVDLGCAGSGDPVVGPSGVDVALLVSCSPGTPALAVVSLD